MIEHVWKRACASKALSSVWVATDDDRIAQACQGFGASVCMTSALHPTGTDRLAEACRDLPCDVVVNIQGDEPLLDPRLIDRVVEALENDPEAPMATLVHPTEAHAGKNPHRVKAVLDTRGRALYFSRSPIPARREDLASQPGARFLQHVGIYAYRRAFLLDFVKLPQTPLEQSEGLEQLRALEHGHAIAAAIVSLSLFSCP